MSKALDAAIDALHDALVQYVEAPAPKALLPIYRAAQQVVRVALGERDRRARRSRTPAD